MESQRLTSLFIALLMGFVCSSQAYDFYVGGRDGWVLNPSENFNHWAERNRFQVNDNLVFKYKKGSDSVLVVSKEDYNSCNTRKPMMKMDNGDSKFKFDRSGTFYFISGNPGKCKKGQKMFIVVLAVRHHSGPPSPTPSWSPSPMVAPSKAPIPSSWSPSSKASPSKAPTPSLWSLSPKVSPSKAPTPSWWSLSPSKAPTPSSWSPSPKVSPSKAPTPAWSLVATPTQAPSTPNAPSSSGDDSGPASHLAPAPAPSSTPALAASIALVTWVSIFLSLAIGSFV